MRVAEILKSKGSRVVTVAAQATLQDAARRLTEERVGALVVQDAAGAVAGILSERDLVGGIARQGAAAVSTLVGDVMHYPVLTCSPGDPVLKVMAMMTDRRVRHLPVVEAGHLLGIVSIGDAVKHRIDEIEAEAKALREYITG
jgi:signal-transduction protein with cAMP-binding, CBS, and nucleotidyltransferase domain